MLPECLTPTAAAEVMTVVAVGFFGMAGILVAMFRIHRRTELRGRQIIRDLDADLERARRAGL